MHKYTLAWVSALSLFLTSCSVVHKTDVEQGNIITAEAVNKLHPGMNMAEVKEIMGSPILSQPLDSNQQTYVYTSTPGAGKMAQKTLILTFQSGVLTLIDRK